MKTVAAQGARMVRRRLDGFAQANRAADEQQTADALHALRVAGKKLRYTMELLIGALPLDAPLAHLVAVQEVLGDLHDADVALEHLAARVPPGASRDWLLQRYQSMREECLTTWGERFGPDVRAALIKEIKQATKH